VRSFTYKYHSTYGSPAINASNRQIKAIVVSPDRMRVRLVVDSLKEGYIHEIKAEGVQSTDKLLVMHNVGYYTLNRIPDGEKVVITSANMVTTADHNMAAMSTAAGATTPLRAAASGKHVTTQPADWTTGADRTIVLGVRPGLKYDVEAITVKAGSKIKLTFNNNDDMQHNVVITEPGMATLVGEMALKLGIDGERLNFVPTTPNVVVHTFLLQPGKSDSIYFLAPDKPGEYQYLCTYPGHFMVMRGTLKVEK
jgi:plastocyanin